MRVKVGSPSEYVNVSGGEKIGSKFKFGLKQKASKVEV